MTRTPWRSSRAHFRTSGHIIAKLTRPCKACILLCLLAVSAPDDLGSRQAKNSSRMATDPHSPTWIGRFSGSSGKPRHSLRTYTSTPYAHIVHPSSRAELAAGWPTVSARAVNSSYRQRGSHTPDSVSLAVLLYPQSLTWLDTGSYTRWTTLVRRITSRLPYSRRRSTCCSFCMPITNSTRVVLRCFRQAAHW
jgi:hypothetical protein